MRQLWEGSERNVAVLSKEGLKYLIEISVLPCPWVLIFSLTDNLRDELFAVIWKWLKCLLQSPWRQEQ